MDQLMAQAATFIEANQTWAGPLLALLAFGESLVFIGFLIPATAMLLLAGTLVGNGALPVVSTILWLVAGAILGDAISYWLGRWCGPALLQRRPLCNHRRSVARARLFFMRYGFMSIFLGRFLGPVRSTIPLVAGMMRMRERSFQIANASSAVIWVLALLAPGYLVAKGSAAAGLAAGEQMAAMITVIIVLSVAGVWLGGRMLSSARRRRGR
ncbi:DedA family protein [Verticiella sediminum]